MDLQMDASFQSLYEEARSELVAGYEEADRRVLSFAIDQGISSGEVWDLIAQEASLRNDDVVEYLAENPLMERSSSSFVAEMTPFVIEGFKWAVGKWQGRGR
ncbi:hypothetical protein GCM10009721_07880 [Terrabacter tumescens]|uniref:Uncharacterized protein n=1 Tax=Terrabacter tumescens TaxID=60443 RepID=A0ABQ2HLW6_9MICO|nr:hypothetical protein [Terrabacter tumescens]GGM85593.1 hypothetical protein GCM10009721_07880 [Terrabacter tumescens]